MRQGWGNAGRQLGRPIVVRRAMTRWTPFDLPYEVHTTRELEFMLQRGKPLSHFCESYPPEPDESVIPRQAFAPYIANGTFEMRTFVALSAQAVPSEASRTRGTIHVFYAPPAEAWRIDAYIVMLDAAAKSGWSEGLEREQGRLLGYTEAQTDAHIQHLLEAPHAKDFPWLRQLLSQRQK
jgi:hypothetical protein